MHRFIWHRISNFWYKGFIIWLKFSYKGGLCIFSALQSVDYKVLQNPQHHYNLKFLTPFLSK